MEKNQKGAMALRWYSANPEKYPEQAPRPLRQRETVGEASYAPGERRSTRKRTARTDVVETAKPSTARGERSSTRKRKQADYTDDQDESSSAEERQRGGRKRAKAEAPQDTFSAGVGGKARRTVRQKAQDIAKGKGRAVGRSVGAKGRRWWTRGARRNQRKSRGRQSSTTTVCVYFTFLDPTLAPANSLWR
ncbi:hypothetical protein JCM11641_006920 [Rhodosporidiobolus odoratus]